MDEACCRIGKDACIGGPLILLSIWSWERFPVGRPRVLDYKNYNDHGNPLRRPTWAYQWDIVSEFSGDPVAAYQTYTNEFDNLTPEQVEWEPYGPRSQLGNASTFTLNPACMAEAHLWYMHCPLVCMWAVEHHMPQRVMRQFGLLQPCPPEWKDTSILLHGFDRRRSKKTDWHNIHKKHVKKFVMRVEEQKKAKGIQYEEHSEDAFNQYLRWFLDNTRVQILPDAYGHEILEEPLIFDDIATLKYNKLVREGRQTSFAPMLNFVRTEIQKQAVEHETALESFPHGEKGESSFREFVKRQGQKLRIMTPSQSRSVSPSDQDDANNSNSTARDEEVSDEAGSEHEVDEDDEDVPLGKYVKKNRSAYKLKPRKERQDRYTPDAYAKAPAARKARKKAVIESDEEEHMEPRQKIPPRRGGKTKRARN
ncbi:hypothetical protein QYE76_058617 [Lolium multiflorum]|uniref:Aminotransferase-like plant mobile domain-containing protein n=1 Tax=Lolium multiflorum TaxID=4521 RepID=A0AAD8T7G9_LOLMU|nr:hypothetical protein QYE76_058617 [Lolium multiflorum]